MIYALHPFPRPPANTGPEQPLPDIRETLASRPACQNERAAANTLLLDVIVDGLHDIGVPFYITHCHETHGDLHLSVTAAGQGHEVAAGDELRGGLFIRNSETCRFETLVCTRLFRVVCENGALMECEKEQSFTIAEEGVPPGDWQAQVKRIIQLSFDQEHLRWDFRRFEATTNQIIITPYEFLLQLHAQRLIDDDEQSAIQAAFQENADFSMYGLINAVTQTAHHHRASDQWIRAFEIERLAGEILRGDHNLRAYEFAMS
ncbi:MAG: hypothetical protein RLO18_04655 [Gimesia chilikensis]